MLLVSRIPLSCSRVARVLCALALGLSLPTAAGAAGFFASGSSSGTSFSSGASGVFVRSGGGVPATPCPAGVEPAPAVELPDALVATTGDTIVVFTNPTNATICVSLALFDSEGNDVTPTATPASTESDPLVSVPARGVRYRRLSDLVTTPRTFQVEATAFGGVVGSAFLSGAVPTPLPTRTVSRGAQTIVLFPVSVKTP
jgi:hypothetical protein